MKIKFLVNVPDKYTGEQYKEGQVKEFKVERAKEILSAKQPNGKPYAEEVKETEDDKLKKQTEELNKGMSKWGVSTDEIVETAKKEVKTEKAVKKTTKKVK